MVIRMNMVCTDIAQLNKHSGSVLSVEQNAPLPQRVPQAVVERQLLLRFQEENLKEIPIHHNRYAYLRTGRTYARLHNELTMSAPYS